MYIFDISIYWLNIAPTWYWLTYALWFIICYLFLKKYFLFKKNDHIDSLLTFVFFWIILGGRLGYVLLYNLQFFINNPLEIIKIWEWWMSFHWWLIGTILSVYLFSKKYSYKFWNIIDILAIIIPIALWLGRIGNYINWELPWYTPYYGILPMNIQWIDHFPSPLFEMLLEGILLFIFMIIGYQYAKNKKPWFMSWLFLIWYSIARIIAEQFRLPDIHIWYILWTNFLTLWILYTIPMILYGIYLIKKNRK